MKNILLASAAVVVCALPMSAQAADLPLKAAPVMATPQASGYIEVYGGWASTRSTESGTINSSSVQFSESIKGSVLGGAGRGNYWLTPAYSMQLDVQAEGTSYNFGSIATASSLDYLIGGHLNWRDPNRGLLGAFAAIGDVNSARHAVFGAEGQYYANQYTLYLQGGYDTTTHNVSGFLDLDAWFIRGTGRYYLSPNLRIEATGMYADGAVNPSFLPCTSGCSFNYTFSTLLWEAKAEWKLDNSPFAFFFKYRGSETDLKLAVAGGSLSSFGNVDGKVTDNRFLVGARMYLGEKSLMWNDRQGATLDIISPLAVQSSLLSTQVSVGSGPF